MPEFIVRTVDKVSAEIIDPMADVLRLRISRHRLLDLLPLSRSVLPCVSTNVRTVPPPVSPRRKHIAGLCLRQRSRRLRQKWTVKRVQGTDTKSQSA